MITHTSSYFILSVFLATSLFANAQTERPLPPPEAVAAAPWWAQQMYGEHPKVPEVDSAYLIWRMDNPAAKTYFTQYYKHWRRAIGGDLSPEGYWAPPSEEEKADAARQWERVREGESANRSTTWENLGPFQTYLDGTSTPVSWQCNVYCLDQSLSSPSVLYAGTENGWIYKTSNGASTWACVSNSLSLSGGVTAIKVHPSDPNTAYFGQGNNVFKTSDGGTTWNIVLTYSGLDASDISINPTDPNIVLVAGEGGLHRSTNGGTNWTQLYSQTCWDIEIKANDDATYFLLKTNTTTKLCEFFKSTDYGATWAQKTAGWIDGSIGSTTDNDDAGGRLAVTEADANRVYAVLLGDYNDGVNDNNFLGVYRSDDAGENWTLPNSNANGGPGGPYAGEHYCPVTFWFNSTHWYPDSYQYEQGIYNMGIDVSDTDADDFLVGYLNLFKSEDGGATFTRWGGYGGGPGYQHPDVQDIDINGSDVWVSSDGGINKYSTDFSSHSAMNQGMGSSEYWGFDGGWNEDVLTGGRYHNGNSATIYGTYPNGEFIRLGGGEATTGFVHPAGGRKVMHSDLSGRILPTTVNGSLGSFTYSSFPNEGYAGNNENSSEIEPDPRCYNHLYMGNANTFQKSTDGGTTWTTLYTFGSDASKIITGIEISRSNPDVIYCLQNQSSNTFVWKSTNGGSTFTQMTAPGGVTVSGGFITLSPTDENTIWFAWNKSNSVNMIYKSTDGGSTWPTNLTDYALFGTHRMEQLQHIGGTGDGIYLATNLGVFYHNGSSWATCSTGLPTKAAINRLLPYYAKGKVRIATYGRGIWQADFVESPTPVVQPTVDKLTASCSRDTFHFDDYSMVNHTGASWSWSFSGTPQYVSSSSVRNPKVVFGAGGTYTATLTLNGVYFKSITVSVSTDCDVTHTPGTSLSLDGSGDYALPGGDTNLNSNTVTITAWIKRNGAQVDWAGLFFARGGTTTTGLSLRSSDHRLAYHWNDAGSSYNFNSGLVVPDNTWTHVALVVTATNAKIYLNGVAATNTAAHAAEAFDTPIKIGYDNSSRYFKGQIDEVTVWNTALTQDQIRDLMNLTIDPTSYPNLVSYYQFNESSGQVLDKVGTRHASMLGNATRSTSTVPVGGGVSARQTVSAAGTYTWGTTGISMQFPTGGTFPNGELSVTRINLDPDQLPNALPNNDVYWVVRNYGSNSTFTVLDYLQFGSYNVSGGDVASQFKLYKRSSTAEGSTWGSFLDSGDEITTGASGSVKFSSGNSNTSFSQFTVIKENALLPVEWLDFKAALQANNTVRLYWSVHVAPGSSHFVVERSANGVDFQALGEVPVVAQSGIQSYESTDNAPSRGLNYYRLRQVDEDGTATFSVIRTVTLEALVDEWVVFPNPLSRDEMLEIRTQFTEPYRFLLYDAKGKAVFQEKLSGGDATLKLPSLAQGTYVYEIISTTQRVRRKLLIQG